MTKVEASVPPRPTLCLLGWGRNGSGRVRWKSVDAAVGPCRHEDPQAPFVNLRDGQSPVLEPSVRPQQRG